MGSTNESSGTSSSEAKGIIVPPPPWRMDGTLLSIGNLMDLIDPKSENYIKINLSVLEYEGKLAQARVDLIKDVKNQFEKIWKI